MIKYEISVAINTILPAKAALTGCKPVPEAVLKLAHTSPAKEKYILFRNHVNPDYQVTEPKHLNGEALGK